MFLNGIFAYHFHLISDPVTAALYPVVNVVSSLPIVWGRKLEVYQEKETGREGGSQPNPIAWL